MIVEFDGGDVVEELRAALEAALCQLDGAVKERDHARQMYCEAQAELDMHDNIMSTPAGIAEELDWECF